MLAERRDRWQDDLCRPLLYLLWATGDARGNFVRSAVQSLEATDPEVVAAMVEASGMQMNTSGRRISMQESRHGWQSHVHAGLFALYR